MSNGYRYVGQGETYRALPPRDLTQEEYDSLPLLEQRTVLESGAYEAILDGKPEGGKPARQADGMEGTK